MTQIGMPRAAAALRGKLKQIGKGVARWNERLGPGVAKTRGSVGSRVAGARTKLHDSLDRAGGTLARSTVGARREIGALRRGVRTGLRAGTEAYRHKRAEK